MVSEITSKAQFDEIINSGKVILIDYHAVWCGPCKQISPVFQKLAEEQKDNGGVEFYKVNVDDVPDVAEECGIRAMPTFQVYHNGVRVDDLVGANPTKLATLVQTGLQLV